MTIAFYRYAVKHCYKGAVLVTKLSVPVFATVFALCAAYCAYIGGFKSAVIFAAVPAINELIIISVRAAVRRKRPFEVLPRVSAPPGCKAGRSFPSNHAASAFIITYAAMSLDARLGAAVFLLAMPAALSRVALAAHYVSDVLSALLVSSTVAYAGYNLLYRFC